MGAAGADSRDDAGLGPGDEGEAVEALQRALLEFGYGVEVTTTYGTGLEKVVEAFQRHFRTDAHRRPCRQLHHRDAEPPARSARASERDRVAVPLVTSKSMPSKV